MNAIHFLLDRNCVSECLPPRLPLLEVIRRQHRITGCKQACGEGDCGSCMVLLGRVDEAGLCYQPAMPCLLGLGAVEGRHVVTIRGLSEQNLSPIQQTLLESGAIQCGFCTPGLVVALTAFFLNARDSNVDAALDAVAGNLCRCTGYAGIKRAIAALCRRFDLRHSPLEHRLHDCIEWRLLPRYFATVPELLSCLPATISPANDIDSLWVGGGSDLWAHPSPALSTWPLYFLPGVDDATCVQQQASTITLSAQATIEQLRHSSTLQKCLPTVSDDLSWVASSPIRQHATLGGNLVNASPIGDLAVWCLGLDAQLHLDQRGRGRQLALRDFFLGYKHTALAAGEHLLSVSFDSAAARWFSFEKVAQRPHLDIASVNSALSLVLVDGVIESVHLSAGGVAAMPLYLQATSDYLRGKALCSQCVQEAAQIAQTEIAPISDLRGSERYKRLLLRQLIYAHFLKLCPQFVDWEGLHDTA